MCYQYVIGCGPLTMGLGQGRCYMLVLAALLAGAGSAGDDSLRPRCPPAAGDDCIYTSSSSFIEHFYSIHGKKIIINFKDGDYFHLDCKNTELDKFLFPRFPREVVVEMVQLDNCLLSNGSYAELFVALNISRPHELVLRYVTSQLSLKVARFDNITLDRLDIMARRNAALKLDTGLLTFLDGGPGKLRLQNVKLDRLPLGIKDIRVKNGGLTSLPIEALDSVERLYLEEPFLKDVSNLSEAPRLRELTLTAPVEELPSLPQLNKLVVQLWHERRPGRRSGCAALQALAVSQAAVRRLPDYWLANCARLQNLTLQELTSLEGLPPELLHNATNLTNLVIQSCNLRELPEDFFSFSLNLRVVNLNNNKLQHLPSKISSLQHLEELHLSNNLLKHELASVLSPLSSLRTLALSRNPLGDLCGAATRADGAVVVRDRSQLALMEKLEVLELKKVNATRLCNDWVEGMPRLRRLDLSHNNITQLKYNDLQVRRRDPAASIVILEHNPIETIEYDRRDYDCVLAGPTRRVKIIIYFWVGLRLAKKRRGRVTGQWPAGGTRADRLAAALRLRTILLRAGAARAPRARGRGRAALRGRRAAGRARAPRAGVRAAGGRVLARLRLPRAARAGRGGRPRAAGALHRRRAAAAAGARARRAERARRGAGAAAGGARPAARAAAAGRARQPVDGRRPRRGRGAAGSRARAAPGRQPSALLVRRARLGGRAARELRPGGGAEQHHVRRRAARAARGVRRPRPGRPRARAGRRRARGRRARRAARARRLPRAARAVARGARRAALLAGRRRRGGGRRGPAVRRVRVVRARGRAVRGGGAGGAAGGGPAAVPAVPALPRLGGGRLDPGADRGVGAAVAAHAGGGVAPLRALGVGARRVPRGARGGAALGAAAAAGRAAGAAARAARAARARAAPLPGRRHLPALGRAALLGPPARRAAAAARRHHHQHRRHHQHHPPPRRPPEPAQSTAARTIRYVLARTSLDILPEPLPLTTRLCSCSY